MRRQCIAVLTAIIAIVMTFSTPIFAAGGDMGLATEPLTDGSEAYPYLIEDFADFDTFAYDHYYWASGVHTRLDFDLDLDPALSGRQTYTTAVIAPDASVTPFTGVFDGNDHIISNLAIDTAGVATPFLGLFGKIDGVGAEVKNLGIEDSHITGAASTSQYYSGILCGYSDNGALIDHCYTTGSVTGGGNLGGLCGRNVDSSTISNCYSTAPISGISNLGGLCGINSYATITNSYATGSVTSESGWLGGLCGANVYATITNCHATGDVGGGYAYGYRGGLCGTNSGTVSDCYATGTVNGGNDSVGGLCGENSNGGTLRYCYATGAVDGLYRADYLGGLCGANSSGSDIINCYATGAVSNSYMYGYIGGLCGYQRNDYGSISYCYSTGTVPSGTRVGGLCGLKVGNNTITNSYWDTQTSGTTTSSGGVGKTTALMQTQSTFTGWNFSSIWWINGGRDYPKLDWQPVADFNNDSRVNLVDFAIMSISWLTSDGDVNYNSVCELSGDTTINAADLTVLAENWLVTGL